MEIPVMAHFAELDLNNIVLRVVVVNNNMIINEQEQESEALGVSFCQLLFGLDTMWKQTSYNGNIRKNYAGIGFTFDAVRNAFIAPKPEDDGWTFDEDLCTWRNLELEEAQKNVQIGITRV
jgi:hypothetical protein